MMSAKQKLLNTPLATSLGFTMSRKSEKNAWNGMAMWLFISATTAPPSQPTRMAKTTSIGSAKAMATNRGNTR